MQGPDAPLPGVLPCHCTGATIKHATAAQCGNVAPLACQHAGVADTALNASSAALAHHLTTETRC